MRELQQGYYHPSINPILQRDAASRSGIYVMGIMVSLVETLMLNSDSGNGTDLIREKWVKMDIIMLVINISIYEESRHLSGRY